MPLPFGRATTDRRDACPTLILSPSAVALERTAISVGVLPEDGSAYEGAASRECDERELRLGSPPSGFGLRISSFWT